MVNQNDVTVDMLLEVYSELSRKMAGQRIKALTEHLRNHEMSLNQFSILNIIHRDGPSLSIQLAQILKLKAASITYLVDSLEKRGWIKRLDNPEDLRSHYISLTDEGHKVALVSQDNAMAAELFGQLSQDDIEILYVMMRVLNRKLHP